MTLPRIRPRSGTPIFEDSEVFIHANTNKLSIEDDDIELLPQFSSSHSSLNNSSDYITEELQNSLLHSNEDIHHVQCASTKEHGSSIWDATFNFTNSIIGAGIIGIPYAILQAGTFSGVFLLILLSIIVNWTVSLLIKDAKLSGQSSYQSLIYYCFGRKGYMLISIFQFIFAYGAMCAYAVIIGDTMPLVFSQIISESSILYKFLTSRRFMIAVCNIFISLPLSMFQDISKLAKTSALSLAAIIFIIFSILVRGPQLPIVSRGSASSWSFIHPGIVEAIGVISFAFVCHHNTFLIYGSLIRPTMDRFALVTHLSTGASLICCLLLGLGGYLVFVEKTEGNILNNFPEDDLLINFSRLLFAANMFLTIPLECFVCREVLFEYIFTNPSDNPNKIKAILHNINTKTRVGVTALLVLSSMCVALITCDLGFVLEITGGCAATMLAFILPSACYIKLTPSIPTFSKSKLGPLICIAFGFAIMILSTLLTIIKFFTASPDHKKEC